METPAYVVVDPATAHGRERLPHHEERLSFSGSRPIPQQEAQRRHGRKLWGASKTTVRVVKLPAQCSKCCMQHILGGDTLLLWRRGSPLQSGGNSFCRLFQVTPPFLPGLSHLGYQIQHPQAPVTTLPWHVGNHKEWALVGRHNDR